MNRSVALGLLAVLLYSAPAFAKPKKKTFNNPADQVFTAALRTARERHVVTYVDEKQLLMTFQTGMSFWSYGFVANASVEPEGENRATLILNVQNKQGLSMGAGDRMADKFFKQVEEALAGDVSQKSGARPEAKAITVADPKAVPQEPSMTKAAPVAAASESGLISVLSTPEHAEIAVDGAFVGNAPADLKLAGGKHVVAVTAKGYKPWTKDLMVLAGSQVHLRAELEKE